MNSQNPAASPATSHHGTAVLDRTSGPLCNAARDTRRSDHAPEPLEGVNPAGCSAGPAARGVHYHHLFRDLLREELRRHEPELSQQLQARADGGRLQPPEGLHTATRHRGHSSRGHDGLLFRRSYHLRLKQTRLSGSRPARASRSLCRSRRSGGRVPAGVRQRHAVDRRERQRPREGRESGPACVESARWRPHSRKQHHAPRGLCPVHGGGARERRARPRGPGDRRPPDAFGARALCQPMTLQCTARFRDAMPAYRRVPLAPGFGRCIGSASPAARSSGSTDRRSCSSGRTATTMTELPCPGDPRKSAGRGVLWRYAGGDLMRS